MWKGPCRVASSKSDWVFEVKDIIDQRIQLLHVSRMILYRADQDGKKIDLALIQYASIKETEVQTADSLCDIRDGPNGIVLLVQWDGLPDEVDRTWEPLSIIAEDLPGVLQDFLYTTKKRELKKRAM
ncbi:hypothetical protein BWQ96_06723 [Gracilariopsis chorda]|uniref:Chromo domain-containing protein n=1 Tax=Gracilariopsis chorda TaxID=448386 RepID=A0A2V3IN86_9FLOR|nr:hypothetical protein BWQ96_06723 [Gracilariopsis chorda]|eukprot:PXF43546.1 hypothetical protein BWQ96_06723 [Gracilariopsis chorda]